MDPNQWRNYNQAYGHISHSSGLSPTAANLNRFELPLLNADQALSTGLGLGPSLQPHSSSMASARSMGGLGAVPSNYPHPLHNTMTPFLDAVNPLPSAFPAQSPYKSLGQSSFGMEAPSLRSPDQTSLYGFTTVAEGRSHSKSIYAQDSHLAKEQLNYGLTSSASQLSNIEKSVKSSSWNLSNFVPNASNPFGNLSTEVPSSISDLVGPPPAHSGNTSSSRHSTIQRNPFPSDLFSHAPLTNKNSRGFSLDKPEDLLLTNPSLQLSRGIGDTMFSSPSQHGIENLTKTSSQPNSIFGFPPSSVTTAKSDLTSNYQQQLSSDINYDPVSPPTPLSDSGHQQSEGFNTVGLHEISPMGHSHGSLHKQEERLGQDPHQVVMHSHSGKSGSVQNIPMELNNNPNQMCNSPMQQSPISVGGSPHMSVPMSSPQTPLPSSTVVQAPPPVQAVADSTTKPKRIRGRKKKNASIDHENAPESLASQHMVNQHGDLMGMTSPIASSGHLIGLGTQGFNQTNPYSPQKTQPYSPHTRPQYSSSPKKSQSVSPQSYSPQITSQAMIDKVYNNHQASPVVEEQFSMQHSTNLSSQNQMTIPSSSNHLSMLSESVIRSGGQGSVIHNMTGDAIRQPHQPHVATPSPPEQQGRMSVNSMPMSDMSTTPLADAIVGNNNSYNFNSVPGQSFVEQLQSDSNIDHLNKSPMDDPLSMSQLDLQSQQGTYVSPQQNNYMSSQQTGYVTQQPNSIYTDLDSYNNQYDNAHGSLTSPPMGFEQSPHPNNTSTIDEDALSSLIGNPLHDTSSMKEPSPEYWRQRTRPEQKQIPSRTVTSQIELDDDFIHLAKPPVLEKKETKPNVKPMFSSNSQPLINPSTPNNLSILSVQRKSEQIAPVKKSNSNTISFMDSFLSFIQGKKPETLSSLHTSNVKKPELPKYIPEPRRPRPVESSDSAASTPRPDTDNKSEFSSNTGHNSPSTSQNDDTANSRLTFSDDDEEDGTNLKSTVQNVLSDLGDEGSKKDSLKMRISFSKITGTGKKKKKSNPRVKVLSSSRKGKGSSKHFSGEYNSSADDEFVGSSSEDEAELTKEKEPTPPPPEPTRQLSSRRAKEKGQQKRKKYTESSDSDVSLEFPNPINKDMDSEGEYDSDKDPAWTPFAVDNKRQPSFDSIDYHGLPKKGRPRSGRGRGRGKNRGSKRLSDTVPPQGSVKMPKNIERKEPINNTSHEDELPPENNNHETVVPAKGYEIGDFIMDKKDLNKFENFPIWRIESEKLIRKFELINEAGEMRHKTTCTFSSWLPIMQKDYQPIQTRIISAVKDREVVEVLESDKPTPKLDSYLEHAYEEDPLADLFNVYLQIFLSQALEPGFLSAIGEGEDNFYMGPLQSIDKIIEKKLDEMEESVKWKASFKNALRAKPHIRELDRPHLKQSCQACENASQPAIKSIHLFGQSYDHFSLKENTSNAAEGGSLEFLIGKTAASYVGPYHSLYHFKYNLYKRCLAKVDIVRQSDSELDNAEVLDRCLNNRTWVLKIYDDLKNMLDKG